MQKLNIWPWLTGVAVCTVVPSSSLWPATNEAVMTVDGLVSEALERNPELKFYKAELAAAKAERKQAGAFKNPELSANIGSKKVSGRGLSSEGAAWSVAVVQPFEFPGRMALRKAIANRQVDLADLGYEQFRAALAARVQALGLGLAAAQRKAQAAHAVASRGQELASVLVQRDPAGISPLLETRIIEASVIIAKRRAAQASHQAQVALYELNQLRGAPLASNIVVSVTNLVLPALRASEDLAAIARTNSFQVRTRLAELEQQGFKVDLSRNERWPAVSLGPFYSEERAGEKERVAGLAVSMAVPLWNRNAGSVQSAEARRQQAEAALAIAQREAERAVRESAAAYNAFVEQLHFLGPASLSELEAAAELADRHYRLGAVPVSTYVEMQEKYLEATEAVLELQSDAMENLQQLKLLTGEEVVVKEEKP